MQVLPVLQGRDVWDCQNEECRRRRQRARSGRRRPDHGSIKSWEAKEEVLAWWYQRWWRRKEFLVEEAREYVEILTRRERIKAEKHS